MGVEVEHNEKLIELSDEIEAINLRMMERARSGEGSDPADQERLADLIEELRGDQSLKR